MLTKNVYRIMVSSLVGVTISANIASAQCSGRGGSSGASAGGVALASSLSPAYAFQASGMRSYPSQQALMAQRGQMLAMQQQMYFQQQQLFAMRQQAMQQQAEAEYARQQKINSISREQADQKRAERAERIAAMKAKRDTERLASKVPAPATYALK